MCWNYVIFLKMLEDSTEVFNKLNQLDLLQLGGFSLKLPGGGRITSFSIRLPHNSLLVCWEGFQEFWSHEVRPKWWKKWWKQMKSWKVFVVQVPKWKKMGVVKQNYISYGYLLLLLLLLLYFLGGYYTTQLYGDLKKNIKGIMWTNHESISIIWMSVYIYLYMTKWWFQTFLMFTPIWGNDPFWLIFSNGLKPPTR